MPLIEHFLQIVRRFIGLGQKCGDRWMRRWWSHECVQEISGKSKKDKTRWRYRVTRIHWKLNRVDERKENMQAHTDSDPIEVTDHQWWSSTALWCISCVDHETWWILQCAAIFPVHGTRMRVSFYSSLIDWSQCACDFFFDDRHSHRSPGHLPSYRWGELGNGATLTNHSVCFCFFRFR